MTIEATGGTSVTPTREWVTLEQGVEQPTLFPG